MYHIWKISTLSSQIQDVVFLLLLFINYQCQHHCIAPLVAGSPTLLWVGEPEKVNATKWFLRQTSILHTVSLLCPVDTGHKLLNRSLEIASGNFQSFLLGKMVFCICVGLDKRRSFAMKYDLYPDYICTNGRLPSVDGHLGPEFENKGTASQSRDSTFFLCFNPVARRGNPRTWAVLNATENGWPLITTWSISKIMFFVSDFFSTQCSCFEGPKKNQRTWFSSTVLLHQVQAACHPIGGAHHPGMGVPLQATLVIVHRQHPHKLLEVDETWSWVVISLQIDFFLNYSINFGVWPLSSRSASLIISSMSSSKKRSPKLSMHTRNSSLEIFPSPSVSKALMWRRFQWEGGGD